MTKIISLDQCEYSINVIHIKFTQNRIAIYYIPFRNAAKASTIETPLRLSPPVKLFQEALIIIASVPDVRGAKKTAYALVPFRI